MIAEELGVNPMASVVFSNWLHNTSIHVDTPQGCNYNSTCSATISAPGLASAGCTTQNWPITKAMTHSFNASWGNWHMVENTSTYLNDPNHPGIVSVTPALEVFTTFTINPDNDDLPESLVFETAFLQMTYQGGGQFTQRKCNYTSAILAYDVQFESGSMILPPDTSSNRIIARANNTAQFKINGPTSQPQTLSYFSFVYQPFSKSNVSVVFPQPSFPGQVWSGDTGVREWVRLAVQQREQE